MKVRRYAEHVRKVQMFNEAEIGIFTRTGLTPVFFGDTLIGTRMPSLTYMLTFADMADLNAKWNVFVNDPAWKETLAAAAVCGCGDCEQYLQFVFESVELLADLGHFPEEMTEWNSCRIVEARRLVGGQCRLKPWTQVSKN